MSEVKRTSRRSKIRHEVSITVVYNILYNRVFLLGSVQELARYRNSFCCLPDLAALNLLIVLIRISLSELVKAHDSVQDTAPSLYITSSAIDFSRACCSDFSFPRYATISSGSAEPRKL